MSSEQTKPDLAKNRTVLFAVGGVVLLVIIILAAMLFTRPARSVEAFCSTFKQENTRLADSQGDTYSVKPFTNSSSNPRDFADALGKLERVAPDNIQPDVKTLKQLFEKIDKDPSQAFSASMSGLGAEDSVNKYTAQHCKE
ncbi:hypothetical protein LCH21_04640 [Patescibacteria group bacterium]|jgi:biopolymer transport protein ExbB/TolQ|nr:hypothetical protein [Patescibacteria group bacterium]